MAEESPRAPSYVVVMGDADRDVLDALKDRRPSIRSDVLHAQSVEEAAARVLRARPDLAVVPEDVHGQSHLQLCQRIKQLNRRIATVVIRERLTEIPRSHPAVDDYVALGRRDAMMARINVLLRLRTYNARAGAIRERLLEAFRAFDLPPGLLAGGRLLPPSQVDFRDLVDTDALRDHEAALSRLGNTSFAVYRYAPEPPCVCTSGGDGCLRGYCPVAQALSSEASSAVACEACRTAAWDCAREALLADEPREALCPGGTRIAAFPISLHFRTACYPLLAVALALPSPVDLAQLDRLAQRLGEDPARLRRAVADRPLPELPRVHLQALLDIEKHLTAAHSRRVSGEYATAYNVLVEAVQRWEHDRTLTHRTRQLQRANERLRETNRLRNEFLANVSHELKTPMTAIIGFVTLLLRGNAGELPDKARQFLDRILANARTLHAAINDVLDLAQLGGPHVQVHPSIFDPAGLLRECIEHIRPTVADKPIALHADLPPHLPPLETDRDRLRQILLNLLSNAVKFTNEGEVRLAAWPLGDGDSPRLAIAVSDTGVGLPTEALPHIFEEFRQVDGSATRLHGGAGLGLSLVKKLCHLLGGDITVESRRGQGSTFTVTVPTNLPRLQRERQKLIEQVQGAEPDPQDPSTPIVLVVTEGDPQFVLTLRRWGEPHGLRVASAFGFDQALARARALSPFAILLDVAIPGHEVWELADELRAEPRTTDVPLLVASVSHDAAVAEAAGAAGHLRKPIERDDFLNALDRLRTGETGDVLALVADPAERDRLRQALHQGGFRVVACAGCPEATRFAEVPFGAIVLDPQAEGTDDLTALGCLRAGAWARVPIVGYVAPSCPAALRQPLEAEAAALVPVSEDGPTQVVEAVSRLIAAAPAREAAD